MGQIHKEWSAAVKLSSGRLIGTTSASCPQLTCKHTQKCGTRERKLHSGNLTAILRPLDPLKWVWGVAACVAGIILATCAFEILPRISKGKKGRSSASAPACTWQPSSWRLENEIFDSRRHLRAICAVRMQFLQQYSATAAGRRLCGSGPRCCLKWHFQTSATNNES